METAGQSPQAVSGIAPSGSAAGSAAAVVPVQLVRALQHDLRAPVRHIKGFADLALQALSEGDTADVQASCQRVLQGVADLNVRIERLSAWARLASAQPVVGDVDLAAIAAQAVSTAINQGPRGASLAAGLQWRVSPKTCMARADARWLLEALLELISNSNQAVASVKSPIIAIDFDLTDGQARISVADNGIGLNAQQVQGLFQFFGRVHPGRQFTGTGMGLMIVQRIAQAHAGVIEVQSPSPLGEGCQVTMSWTMA